MGIFDRIFKRRYDAAPAGGTSAQTLQDPNIIAADTTIHEASRKGDLEMVTAMLKGRPGLVSVTDNACKWAWSSAEKIAGLTPLHYAAANGHKEVAEVLLANKAEVSAIDESRRTPLHYAAGNGHKEVVKLLLANKAAVSATDRYQEAPLHYAMGNGHEEVAALLGKGSTPPPSLLVKDLISNDNTTFVNGLRDAVDHAGSGDYGAVAAIQEAIRIRSGKSKVSFYKPGITAREGSAVTTARPELLELARSQALLEDPVHSGDLVSWLTSESPPDMQGLIRDIINMGKVSEAYALQLLIYELRYSARFQVAFPDFQANW